MKFVNIGFGNMVSLHRVLAVVSPDSSPIKRLIQDAKNINRVIDVSCGKKTKAVIITDSEHFILAADDVNTLIERFNKDE